MSTTSGSSDSSVQSQGSLSEQNHAQSSEFLFNDFLGFSYPPNLNDKEKEIVDMIIVGLDEVFAEAWAFRKFWKQPTAPTPEQSKVFRLHVLEIDAHIYRHLIDYLCSSEGMRDCAAAAAWCEGFKRDRHQAETLRKRILESYTSPDGFDMLKESFPQIATNPSSQVAVFEEDLRWTREVKGRSRSGNHQVMVQLLNDHEYIQRLTLEGFEGGTIATLRKKIMVNLRTNMYKMRTIGTSSQIYNNVDVISQALQAFKITEAGEDQSADWFQDDSARDIRFGKLIRALFDRGVQMKLCTGLDPETLRWMKEKYSQEKYSYQQPSVSTSEASQ